MKNLALFLVLAIVIFVRYQFSKPKISDGQILKISGPVTSEPILYQSSQRIRLQNISVTLPRFPEINYGDRVVVKGKVENGQIREGTLVEKKESEVFFLKLREKLISFYQKALPVNHAGLVSGMVLGSKKGTTYSFWQALKESGTLHVVVASGMNVTLVAATLMGMLTVLITRRVAVFLALIGVWFYAFLAGLEAPIVRAALMGSIAFGAVHLGRVYFARRALWISVFLMLFVYPLWLTDIGFILSVVATFSLMLFERKVSSLIAFVPGIFKEGFSTSLAAQIGVAPIIFITFGQFNILSPLINALVLWSVPLITIVGGIAGALSLFSFNLGRLVVFLVYPLTSWFIFWVEKLQ